MTQQQHVVCGAGQIGAALARALHERGHSVRVVRRSAKPVGPGVEVVTADARDAAQLVAATAGADVIYHCMNASEYSAQAWSAELPPMMRSLIEAAVTHGARLVYLDNLYAYGDVPDPRHEGSPMAPVGPKGQVRAELARLMHETHGLRWTAGRASDFFGPGTGAQSFVSMDMVATLGKGGPAMLVANPKMEHAFSWAPDVVKSLRALGEADADVEGRAWHLPVVRVSPRELVGRLAQGQGRRGWALTLPAWLIRGLSGVVPLFGMLAETLYQWERPYLVDDSAFRARFPAVGSSLEHAVQQTVVAAAAA